MCQGFHIDGNIEVSIESLYIFSRGSRSWSQNIFRISGPMPSGPGAAPFFILSMAFLIFILFTEMYSRVGLSSFYKSIKKSISWILRGSCGTPNTSILFWQCFRRMFINNFAFLIQKRTNFLLFICLTYYISVKIFRIFLHFIDGLIFSSNFSREGRFWSL